MKISKWVALCFGICFLLFSCSHKVFKSQWTKITAPSYFKARFKTTKGDFEIESYRNWSPMAVDRLYQLIKTGFYKNNAIFRIDSGYVVQFGISDDTVLNHRWEEIKVPDEPVVMPNKINTVTFARGGAQSRTTQLFINLDNNNSPFLDTLNYGGAKGFPVVANITSGVQVTRLFYSGYKSKPAAHQDSIYQSGNTYLKREFPKLDYIKRAFIIK